MREQQYEEQLAALKAENQSLAAALAQESRWAATLSARQKALPASPPLSGAVAIAREALQALEALEQAEDWPADGGSEGGEDERRNLSAELDEAAAVPPPKPERLLVSPRTLCCVFDSPQRERVLMIKWGPTKGKLAGMCNLLGGHVERGEDVLASAVREAAEESGLSEAVLAKNAQLAGVVHVRDFFGTVRRQPYSCCSDVSVLHA